MRGRARALLIGAAASLGGCAALPEGAPTLGDAVVLWVGQVCAEAPAERASILAEFDAVTAPNALRVECARRE